MARKIRVGLIGAGWWATYAHIPGLLAHPDAEIAAVARRSPDKLAAVAGRYGIPRTFTDYREMIHSVDLDAVVISLPHNAHYPAAKYALEHGLSILLEKPMTLRASEARELVRLAEAGGLQIVMSYPYHYTPNGLQAKKWIQGGEIGEVQFVSTLFASGVYPLVKGEKVEGGSEVFPFEPPPVSTYADPEIAGGGQGQTQTTHPASFVFWATEAQPAEVSAMMGNADLKMDIFNAITYRCTDGMIGCLASTGTAAGGHLGQNEHRFYGSKGFILIELNQGTLSLHKFGQPPVVFDPGLMGDRYPRFAPVQNLVDCLLGRAENNSPGIYGARSVELVEAAYKSAASGHVEKI